MFNKVICDVTGAKRQQEQKIKLEACVDQVQVLDTDANCVQWKNEEVSMCHSITGQESSSQLAIFLILFLLRSLPPVCVSV